MLLSIRRMGHQMLTLLCLGVAACGGGGGGGGGNLSFTLDRNTIAFDYSEGGSPSLQITATAQGSYNNTLYVGAVVEGTAIDPNLILAVNGMQGTFTIRPAAGLAPGSYSGRVLLLACADPQCNTRIGGTPIAVPYTVRVRATLRASPNFAIITGPNATENSLTISLQLPDGVTTSTAAVTMGAADLRLENITATSFRIVGRSLPAGVANGVVRVTSGASIVDIPVTYTRTNTTPDVDLSVSPGNLTFSATEGVQSATQLLTVTPASWDSGYQASAPATWLSLTPVAGGYQVHANAASLTAGSYTTTIQVSGTSPITGRSVSVALTVGSGLVRPADALHVLDAETTAGQLGGSVPINLVAGTPVNWTASDNASWLHLTNASGSTGGTLAYTLDAGILAGLANGGEYSADITITPVVASITPQTFRVSVRLALPRVTSVWPYAQVRDRPLRLVIRGAGFAAISDVAARLQLPGTTPTSITRVSDSEIVLTAPVPVPDINQVSFSNALGFPSAAGSYAVVNPRSFGYAKLPTGGATSALLYDALNQLVFVQNDGLSSLQRFAADPSNGSLWSQTSGAMPQIRKIGLMNDSASLLVQFSGGRISYFDPRDPAFTETKRVTSTRGLDDTLGVIPITNDGHAWFTYTQGPTSDRFGYLDTNTSSFAVTNLAFPTTLINQNYLLARDGERLIINQNSCCTPRPPLLVRDAADGLFKQNDASAVNPFGTAHASDDGNRMVFEGFRVRDRDLSPVGDAVLPPAHFGWFQVGGLMRPHGDRLYMLAYNSAEIQTPQLPAPTLKPRIYVFDTTAAVIAPATLPLIGYFEIDDYPTCRSFDLCTVRPLTAISPDGRTLFIAGSQSLLVVPVPAENTMQAASAVSGGASLRIRTVPWDLSGAAR